LQQIPKSLLLATHVPIRQGKNGPQIDDQTAAGIAQWCKYFDKVTYFGIADDMENSNGSSAFWVDLSDNPVASHCELVALPRAYRPTTMIREYSRVRDKLSKAVATHQHLCFTFGGILGDWPSVAAREAIRQRRPYAAWLDRVEPNIVSNRLAGASLKKRLAWAVARPAVEHNIRYIVERSAVALLQGMDTFEHYAGMSRSPHCTYDTHTHVSDEITSARLDEKRAVILDEKPIKIVYVGRAAPMKGPGDWLDTLERVRAADVPYQATWIGDGPDLPMMQARVAESKLGEIVRLHGFEGDRERLLRAMRESDVFLFCHKTPESPRCLIEALVSGCPLVGYETAYSRGLVEARGGGRFVRQNDIAALADEIVRLHKDRQALAKLVSEAADSGKLYNEDSVYEHRARLMRQANPQDRDDRDQAAHS
jgi:glycosyltransferase involved in cell wall biosynthesis